MRLKIQAYLCKNCWKQQFSMEALFWYNPNPKGIIIFSYDDKQFILHQWELIIPNYNTIGKTIPNHNTFSEIIIPTHNIIWEKYSLLIIN